MATPPARALPVAFRAGRAGHRRGPVLRVTWSDDGAELVNFTARRSTLRQASNLHETTKRRLEMAAPFNSLSVISDQQTHGGGGEQGITFSNFRPVNMMTRLRFKLAQGPAFSNSVSRPPVKSGSFDLSTETPLITTSGFQVSRKKPTLAGAWMLATLKLDQGTEPKTCASGFQSTAWFST